MTRVTTYQRQYTRNRVLLTIAICIIVGFIVASYVGVIAQQKELNRIAGSCIDNGGFVFQGHLFDCGAQPLPTGRVVRR